MISMLGQALLGILAGAVASHLMHSSHGLIMDLILGLAGGWLGGRIGGWLGIFQEGHIMGFVLAVVGAVILIGAARLL